MAGLNKLHGMVWGRRSDEIFVSPLTQSLDLATLSIQENNKGFHISNDGLHLHTCSYSQRRIEWYKMSIPFDLNTAVFQKMSEKVVTGLQNVWFDDTGLKMVTGNNTSINAYLLSVPFDVATITIQSSHTIEISNIGLNLNQSGTKLITSDPINGLTEYSFGTNWDLNTLNVVTTQTSSPSLYKAGIGIKEGAKLGFIFNGSFVRFPNEFQLPVEVVKTFPEFAETQFAIMPRGTDWLFLKKHTESIIKKYKFL